MRPRSRRLEGAMRVQEADSHGEDPCNPDSQLAGEESAVLEGPALLHRPREAARPGEGVPL